MLLFAIGCASVGHVPGEGPSSPSDPLAPVPAPPAVALEVPPAFDPLRGPLAITVLTDADAEVHLELADNGQVVLEADGIADAAGRFVASWDGRDGGAFRDAARYDVVATAVLGGLQAQATGEVAAVRPGFAVAWLEDDDGTTALREGIFFPVGGELQDESDPVSEVPAIDDGQAPLELPGVGDDELLAIRPPDAEPAAFRFDSRPILALELGASEAMPALGLELAPIEVSAEGWTVLSGSPLAAGSPVVLQRDEPLGDTIGVTDEVVVLGFTVEGAPLGEQGVPLRIFRVLDASGFQDAAAAYRPWGPVLSEAIPALEGVAAEHDVVTNALVEWIYRDLGLEYDTEYGASAYSQYSGFDWDRPHFFLSDFLIRRFGNVINCSDAANILGAYSNMVGARLDHLIIDPDFELNQIQAIGGASFTNCPFGPLGCGFSYHAVTTEPESLQVWDATLALDGDADPGSLPGSELLVQAIDATEYLDRLVRSGRPTYHSQSQETLE